jgi:hypothetical protein
MVLEAESVPCHHGMARPPDMEGGWVCWIEPTRSGSYTWWVGGGYIPLSRRNNMLRYIPKQPRVWADSLERTKVKMVNVNISLRLIKHHAMKAYGGIGGKALSIINVCTGSRGVASFTFWSLYPRWKSPRYRVSKLQSQCGRCDTV